MFNPAQDWPVYIFIAIFLGIVAYLIIIGRQNEKKENQNKKSGK